jgi:hypothetical protein
MTRLRMHASNLAKGVGNMEKLPFTPWELAVIEIALRFYADNYQLNSDLVRRQVINLADRIGNTNPERYHPTNR